MSLILKGIDLPEDCIKVEFKYYIPKFNEYTIYDQAVTIIFTAEALNNIIQIPKGHGRLIDADKYQYYGDLEYEPTILESEEDK